MNPTTQHDSESCGPITYVRKGTLARSYSVSERTIDNWVRRGVIPAIKVKRALLFDPVAVRAALARFQTGGGMSGN
jgi:hypothetical protein